MRTGTMPAPVPPIDVDVWVEPTVIIAATGDTICDGGTTAIPVTSTNTTTGGIRYTWTVTANGNITGESASAGNGNDISVPLAQTLDNTSADKQMVTYTLTPWTVDENGNNACPGTPIDVDVWVEPTVTHRRHRRHDLRWRNNQHTGHQHEHHNRWHTVYLDSHRQREYYGRIRQCRQRE